MPMYELNKTIGQWQRLILEIMLSKKHPTQPLGRLK
jgi:hypothetical protein